jgi:threonine synthase
MTARPESRRSGVIERYREFLPVTERTPVISLMEGNTPLIACRRLTDAINPRIELYLKYEGANPTGSFKDRGMTLAISKAKEEGSKAVICASTGNTSASAAAYGARAGLRVYVLIPEGKIAMGKLGQAMIHKATVIQIKGNFDEALTVVKQVTERHPVTVVNSINPYRIEGQKTAAFEICDQLGAPPTYHVLPVGNAGNITAYWRGYRDYATRGLIDRTPAMMGFQAAGAAPIVLGHIVETPQTIASAIRIGNPASWQPAVRAAKESGGEIDLVSDDEILEAYRLVAQLEGVFCEPASAAAVAGVIKMDKKGRLASGDVVVCTLTGHGLKDIEVAMSVSQKPVTVEATFDDVVKALGY